MMSPIEQAPSDFTDPVKNKELTKRVLWKLDTHVLPALVLVRPRLQSMWSNYIHDDPFRSFGSRISLTGPTSEMLSQLAPFLVCNRRSSPPGASFRIAGLEKDTHLHGNQFNTALAGKLHRLPHYAMLIRLIV